MPHYHLVASARWPLQPLIDRESCVDLWARLRSRFNSVEAAVLMPDHVHIVFESRHPNEVRNEFSIVLRAFSRSRHPGIGGVWQPVPEPELIADALKLKRQIRYVHLNPCRAGLVADPLEWEWSTHRDYLGAVFPSWVDVNAAASLWRVRQADFKRIFHSYVSSDPSVRVEGTPAPSSTPALSLASIDSVMDAVLLATRLSGEYSPGGRKLVIHLVDRIAKADRAVLAAKLGIHERTVYKIASSMLSAEEKAALDAAWIVLSDPRMLKVRGVKGQ